MLYTWSALAPAALVLLTRTLECHSAPLDSAISSTGISIPIAKRYTYLVDELADDEQEVQPGNSTNVDSSFNATNVINLTAIKRHIAQVDAKYQQGVFNYQQNTGQIYVVPSSLSNPYDGYGNGDVQGVQDAMPANVSAPSDSKAAFVGKFVTKVPKGSWSKVAMQNTTIDSNTTESSVVASNATLTRRRGSRVARATGALPLQDLQNDLLWAGYVSIGSNGQQFLIDFDTGSSDFWVPSVSCQSEACKGHKRYNHGASTSSVSVSGKEFSISYGDGSSSAGPVYRDDVAVGGMIARAQCFSAVEHISDSFVGDLEDGILGMAYQSISELNEPPFFATLMAQKKVNAPMFAFRLAKKGSELYLGGANPAKYTGAITWYPTMSQSYWLIAGVPQVNGAPVTAGTYSMAVDTGTTVIIAPPDDAERFWSRVPGASRYPYATGYWQYPCHKPPKVSFVFAGSSVAWSVSTADFNLGQVSRGSSLCVGAIVGQDVGIKAWILGDSFLKNVYSIYDMQQNRVGFAKPV